MDDQEVPFLGGSEESWKFELRFDVHRFGREASGGEDVENQVDESVHLGAARYGPAGTLVFLLASFLSLPVSHRPEPADCRAEFFV